MYQVPFDHIMRKAVVLIKKHSTNPSQGAVVYVSEIAFVNCGDGDTVASESYKLTATAPTNGILIC